jgi:hypothetical protein
VKGGVAVLALLVGLVVAGRAAACACCAEPGTWYQVRTPVRGLERGEIRRLRFTTANRVQTNEGGPGFSKLPLRTTLTGRVWRWRLGTGRTLTLRLPASGTTLAADVFDGKMSGGGGPLLYKELRLEGSLTTAGIPRGTRYRLVLQGRGNNCLNGADFRSWHLDVSGGSEPYSLYGTFR